MNNLFLVALLRLKREAKLLVLYSEIQLVKANERVSCVRELLGVFC